MIPKELREALGLREVVLRLALEDRRKVLTAPEEYARGTRRALRSTWGDREEREAWGPA